MDYSYAWKSVLSPGKSDSFFTSDSLRPFETGGAGFSRNNAWWLSELSRLIYLRGSGGQNPENQTEARNFFLHRVGMEERWFLNGEFVQCAIMGTRPGVRHPFSVLVFRGTQGSFGSWLYNFSTMMSPWPSGGSVHRGFKLLLLGVWEEIKRQLKTISGPVYYTGHSLGGALAVLSASLKKPAGVYTFGSPRVGNLAFKRSVNNIKIYRIMTKRDIVTVVPPFPGIFHTGEAHRLICDETCRSSRSWSDAPGFLADHSPLNYTFQL